MISILKIAAAPILGLLGKGSNRAALLQIAAAGIAAWFFWNQYQNLQEARNTIETERSARIAAEVAVGNAVERAERLAAARDEARARLTDRVQRVEQAQGQCLETELPSGLLDR